MAVAEVAQERCEAVGLGLQLRVTIAAPSTVATKPACRLLLPVSVQDVATDCFMGDVQTSVGQPVQPGAIGLPSEFGLARVDLEVCGGSNSPGLWISFTVLALNGYTGHRDCGRARRTP